MIHLPCQGHQSNHGHPEAHLAYGAQPRDRLAHGDIHMTRFPAMYRSVTETDSLSDLAWPKRVSAKSTQEHSRAKPHH